MPRPSRSTAIIEVGLALLRTRPYLELTLDDVAEAAGVTRGLLLYYFRTRENFFIEVARHYVRDSITNFGPGPSKPGEPEWLENEVEHFLQMMQRDYLLTQAITVEMAGLEGQREVIDEMNNFTAARVCTYFGITPEHELLMGVLRAWGRACVDLALRGLKAPFVTEAQLKDIMLAHVHAVVGVVLDASRQTSGNIVHT